MRLLPLAAVLLFASLPGRAADDPPSAELKAKAAPVFATLSQEILKNRDPYAAQAFLEAPQTHELLWKADKEAFDKLFQAASQLSDLHKALVDHGTSGTLREALTKRDGYPLLDKPSELLAWRKRYADFQPESTLRSALLEWDTLSPEVQGALKAAGRKPKDWGGTAFSDRADALDAALTPAVDRIKGAVARTPAEAAALRKQFGKLYPYLDKDEWQAINQHLEKVDAAAAALADAEKRVKGNPALTAKLAEARNTGDVDGMLGKLGSLFDGMNVRNEGVERTGPGRSDQRLDDVSRKALSEMLVTGVKREMAGTTVGDRLLKMYDKEPFNLVVRPMPPGIMGMYHPDTNILSVSEELLTKMAREQGKTAADLMKGEMFDRALKSTLSTIVHEAVHQEQNVWRRDHKVPYWDVVEHEIEAKQLEATFILQKSAQDPKGYGKFMAKNQNSSMFVREAALLADKMRRSPDTFRMAIQSEYYPSEVSIEGNAARAYDHRTTLAMRDTLRAELARRAALPPAERAALESAGAARLDGRYTMSAWLKELSGLKEETLRNLEADQVKVLEARLAAQASVPGVYAQYRARDAETTELTAGVLARLTIQPNGKWTNGAGTAAGFVPPPLLGGSGGGGSPPPRRKR